MLRRRVITGEPELACGRLIRIARVAGKPGDDRSLIVAATERTTVRQITASVSIRQEPEHTRDQKQQTVSVAVEPIGIRVQSIADRAFCKVKVLSKHLLEKGPAMDRPVYDLASERRHGSIRFETHALR